MDREMVTKPCAVVEARCEYCKTENLHLSLLNFIVDEIKLRGVKYLATKHEAGSSYSTVINNQKPIIISVMWFNLKEIIGQSYVCCYNADTRPWYKRWFRLISNEELYTGKELVEIVDFVKEILKEAPYLSCIEWISVEYLHNMWSGSESGFTAKAKDNEDK